MIPNIGNSLECDTFFGKSIFHKYTKIFPKKNHIFYNSWKRFVCSSVLCLFELYNFHEVRLVLQHVSVIYIKRQALPNFTRPLLKKSSKSTSSLIKWIHTEPSCAHLQKLFHTANVLLSLQIILSLGPCWIIN